MVPGKRLSYTVDPAVVEHIGLVLGWLGGSGHHAVKVIFIPLETRIELRVVLLCSPATALARMLASFVKYREVGAPMKHFSPDPIW